MLKNFSKIADALLLIEKEIRDLGLWETQSPSKKALSSSLPFCCDTLTFVQWLQWVFIPRVKSYIENDQSFPFTSQIAPYAEEVCRKKPQDLARLHELIREFDDAVSS